MTHPQEGGTGGEVSEILFFSAKSKRRPSLIYSMQIIPVCLSIVARRKGVSATRRGGLNWTPISLLVGHPCKLINKLIDDLDAKDALKVLWDPANNCWCHERAWPDGYREVQNGFLGHVHIKDVQVDTPRATLEVRELGTGQLADQFRPLAAALRSDDFDGVFSLESVYHPGNGNFEDGFRRCVGLFKEIFG